MTHPNPSTALAAVVIDELAALGVETIVVSPGSRSAALAIAAESHPRLRAVVAIDERSAAFHALGVAKAGGRPAAVLATSGTAVANHFPAVVEADMACVPLVVISADRPAELHGVGANQTIDQVEIFGGKVRRYFGIAAPDAETDRNAEWRSVVGDSIEAATGARPGPVHLNIAFREPTVPVSDDGRTSTSAYPFETPRLERELVPHVAAHGPFPLLEPDEGVVIAGDGDYDRADLLDVASNLGWPVLATALSGLRGHNVVSTYHHLLARDGSTVPVPRTVVAVGAIGPSDSLEELVSSAANRVRIDAWGRHIDPRRNANAILTGDPVALLRNIEGSAGQRWRDDWLQADIERRALLDSRVDSRQAMTGGGVAHALDRVGWECLVVGSSLPIREVDAHLNRSGTVIANRGASGIDGFVSTALGVASVKPKTLALCGDLTLLHDGNGFLIDTAIDLTLIVIDNAGGGLFDSLPQAVHAPGYERLFVAAPQRDFETFARLNRMELAVARDVETLVGASDRALSRGGLHLIVVPVDRRVDIEARRQLLS